MTPQFETIPLGQTDLRVSPLGLGVWQWGDTMMWGYGKGYGDADLKPVYEATLAAGINFIDTAEMYGRGRSERVVGQFMRETNTRDQVVLATKFMPLPWRLSPGRLVHALRESLNRLGLSQVDLYQVHFPMPPLTVETWAEALADAVEAGLTRAVGVSNLQRRPDHARACDSGETRHSAGVQSSGVQSAQSEAGNQRPGGGLP